MRETPEIRVALVAELSRTMVPTSIMGVTLLGVGLFAYAQTGLSILLLATIWGCAASAAKVAVMALRPPRTVAGPAEAVRLEAVHGALTAGMASAVGVMSCVIFRWPDPQLKMLATGLLFGYASGLVGRTAIRPRIAVFALCLAALPTVVAAALGPDMPHRLMAAIFATFFAGGLQSVRHLYLTAVGHVGTRLEMAHLALHDPLTGLANRLGIREIFVGLDTGAGRPLAVHCLDLDGFKSVNDRYGHSAGDALLIEVARRIAGVLPETARAARMGGDEFVVLQPGLGDAGEAETVARRIDARLREPFAFGGQTIRIGVSIGYALSAQAAPALDALLRQADEASYRIKRMGGGVAAGSGARDEADLRDAA